MRAAVKTYLGFPAFATLALLLFLGGCGRPKEIPEAKLKEITKDIFLSNAYVTAHGHFMHLDSLDIYTPIFRKYGYTVKDFNHTLESFSRRKSSRLSYIINEAYAEFDKQYSYYQKRIAILDTIELLAGEQFKRQVFFNARIRASRIQDTSRLKVTIPVETGSYKVSFYYKVDSLDANSGHRTTFSTIDSAGYHNVVNTQWMTRYERQHKEVTITPDASAKKMLINLGTYPKSAVSPLDITIDSLVITHFLPAQVALDSITKTLVDYKLIIDGTEYQRLAKDSLAIVVQPPWAATQHGGDGR